MNRLEIFLRYLATWPQGRLALLMYQNGGQVVMSAVDIDNRTVLGPAREVTVDECVASLMQSALVKLTNGAGT